MNKLIVAMIAGAFASVAAAQTAAPAAPAAAPMAAPAAPAPLTTKERQQAVMGTTQAGSGSSASTQKTAADAAKNTAASKNVTKATTAEKNAAIKATNQGLVNPNNPTGVAGTAAMQKQTTAVSAGTPKANVELKSKEGQKALDKDLTQKSTAGK